MDLKITSYQLNKTNALPSNNIRCMIQDQDGFLWLGTLNGLYRFDGYQAHKITNQTTGNKSLIKENRISKLEHWKDGQLAVTFPRYGVIGFNTKHHFFEPLKDSIEYVRKSLLKQDAMTDNCGNQITVINGTENIIYQNIKTGQKLILKAIPQFLWELSSDIKLKVVTDKRGFIWTSTAGGGITVYDNNGNKIKRITANESEKLIPSDYITEMIEDRNGRILVCEQWYGITILSIEEKEMDIAALGKENDIANAKEVKVLTNASDKIIVANDMGNVFTLDDNGLLHPVTSLPTNVEYLYITTDSEGCFLAGTRKNGLYTYEGFLTHSSDLPSIKNNRIDHILVDSKDRIWICNINGMVDMLERKGQKWTFSHFFSQIEGLEVKSMICDHNNQIWMATNIGVLCFNPENLIKDKEEYIRYPLSPSGEEVRVTCLMEDSKHTIWAGTSGWGVFSCSDGKNFIPFKKQTGATRVINAITEDTEQNIWMAGDEGAVCYSPIDDSAFKLYSESSPLRNIFNIHCAAKMSNGKVALGTLDGIAITDAEMIRRNKVKQTLQMSEIKVNGMTLQCHNDFQLKHDQNTLTFFFTDLSFNINRPTYYTYQMEGLDMQWSEPTTANFANFNSLPPGKYSFHVKIIDSDTKAREQSVKFVILPPWWQTWWFRLSLFIVLATIIIQFYIHHLREFKLKQAVHDERLLTEYRIRFFTNISHEFRTPLTLIQGSMDKILSLEGTPKPLLPSIHIMQRNVIRMKRLIDQFLEFRKMETGNLELRLEQVEIIGILKDIFLSFRDISERRRINYNFSSTNPQLIMYADRSHIDKIAYNLLSNAFKYTPVGGDISMKLSVTDKELVVRIQDTGIGIPEKTRNQLFNRYNSSKTNSNSIGIGLNLAAELIQRHHGTIIYQPESKGGSTFQFTLPLDKSIYKTEDFLQESELRLQQDRPMYPHLEKLHTTSMRPMNDKTVLIVEDDIEISDFLQQELSNYFHIEIANDGAEAIEVIEEKMPDLIITDIRMPHMDGFQLLAHIRKSSYQYLPVIMLTAVDTTETEIKSIQRGADVYLPKPFDMRILVAHCAALVQRCNNKNNNSATIHHTQEAQSSLETAKKTTIKAQTIITDERDRKFLDRFNTYIQNHFDDKDLNIDHLAEMMGYSRSKFYRKVSTLIGCSPKEYIRKLRIERAAELLHSSETITIAEVAYMTGFNTPQYFSTVFRAYYNMLPSEYQKQNANPA